VIRGGYMTRRRWTTVFILSFIPLGVWLIFWFYRIAITGGFGGSGWALAFIIPTAVYVCIQVWLAIRAFTA